MQNAIKITLTKAEKDYGLTASKLFGAPVLPEAWGNKFSEDIIFFGQIRLSDIAELDTENRLPHSGYIYLFLDTEIYPYTAWAEYSEVEPRLVIDDFNEIDPRFEHLNQAFVMSFSRTEDICCDGNRLFGLPSSGYESEGELFLQFDPLDTPTGFLEEIDGYAYFFFGEDGRSLEEKIDSMTFAVDRS